jgi:hypothetical protein
LCFRVTFYTWLSALTYALTTSVRTYVSLYCCFCYSNLGIAASLSRSGSVPAPVPTMFDTSNDPGQNVLCRFPPRTCHGRHEAPICACKPPFHNCPRISSYLLYHNTRVSPSPHSTTFFILGFAPSLHRLAPYFKNSSVAQLCIRTHSRRCSLSVIRHILAHVVGC